MAVVAAGETNGSVASASRGSAENGDHFMKKDELLSENDLGKIWDWNRTVPKLVEKTIHAVVDEWVKAMPGAPAVCAWDGKLSYRELDNLATKLAAKLMEHIEDSETIIPLYFGKSMLTPVAMLAVLKAGASFTLLDPQLSEELLADAVRQTKAKFVVSSAANEVLASRLTQNVIVVTHQLVEDLRTSTLTNNIDFSQTAYVVFTSGSTGPPKGVKISHQNAVSALHHQGRLFRYSADTRIYDHAPCSSDVSIHNVVAALSVGGCVCIPSQTDRDQDLAENMRDMRVTHAVFHPSETARISPQDVPTLKSLTVTGEASSVKDLKHWENQVRLNIAYGLTECTTFNTLFTGVTKVGDKLGVGRGEGVVTWLVDPQNHQKLLSIGHIGEIVIEGPLITPGYLNTNEQAEDPFIVDPLWLLKGSSTRRGRSGRLFKSGDLARYNTDGRLELIGRKGEQVVIQNHGVQAAEAEYQLRSLMPQTARVVVEAMPSRNGDESTALVAVVQPNHTSMKPRADEVELLELPRDFEDKLRRHLPGFMVPTLFLTRETLPLTATAKVDRRRLREIIRILPGEKMIKRSSRFSVFETESTNEGAQQQMQDVWAQVLKIDSSTIGPNDNFFNLGGDSMAALKVVGEARKLGLDSAVADIFRHPNLNDIVNHGLQESVEASSEATPFSLLDSTLNFDALNEEYGLKSSAIEDAYPCTPLQEGLLSLSALRPGTYIMQGVLELSPTTDIVKFRKAWEDTVRSTPVLRTRIIRHEDTRLVQVVVKEELQWAEATDLDEYLAADAARAMDLGQALTRYAFIKDHKGMAKKFVWTVHHSVYDGWAQQLVLDAVSRAYRGVATEASPAFSAFCKYIKEQDSDMTAKYWRKTLQDCDSVQFPTLPSTVQPLADTTLEHQMSPVTSHLSSGITISTLIHAAWALVTGSMTNSKDVVFGATLSGRNAPIANVDTMIAPTIATVPVRVKWSRDSNVSHYLKDVQRNAAEMIPFEQAGLHHIQKMSQDGQKACGFQTLLIIQPKVKRETSSDFLGTWREDDLETFNTYALMIEVLLSKDEPLVKASFDSRLISPETVKSLLQHLEHTMLQLNKTSHDQTISEIEMKIAQDLEQIAEWNRELPASVERCVHELVEERARTQPKALAVSAWDGELTYEELDRKATLLADRLCDFGVVRDKLVPLCFEKSAWTSVAMLAVLKAGGGFVLLDSAFPERRLKAIVQQVGSNLILSSAAKLSLSSRLSNTVVEVSENAINSLQGASRPTFTPQSSSAIMFAVFTSGSTGNPKGVLLTHANFASSLSYQTKKLGFHRHSRVFDFASYAFDIAVSNAFSAWVEGGCLCVPSDQDRLNNIGNTMAAMQVTITHLTPSVARLVDTKTVPTLETLMLGGEAVSGVDVERWLGKTNVIITYGPAEATPTSTIHADAFSPLKATSIGKGVGVITWIVDAEDESVLLPPGSVGELLLEGPLVGQGYLNDPDRTAAAFIKAPKWLKQDIFRGSNYQGRLYKTGDLVSYNPDGTLTFVGRKDAQVKIRGQRVELGEIEVVMKSYISKHTQVASEVIIPQGQDHKPAVAVFLQDEHIANGDTGTSSDVRVVPMTIEMESHLDEHLPGYMIPTVLFSIRRLPMTASGKLDRRRLREIGSSFSTEKLSQGRLAAGRSAKQQPTLEIEGRLQKIWSQVLNIEQQSIGIDESFFRLGGDSISAMQVSATARVAGIRIHSADVLREKTIYKLARASKIEGSAAMSINGTSRVNGHAHGPSNVLSPIQRLYFQQQPDPTKCFDQCFLLKVRSKISPKSLRDSIQELVRTHDSLRARFKKTSAGAWEQHFTENIVGSFDVRVENSKKNIETTISHCRDRLDIENGPLLAAVLLDSGCAQEQHLFISIHHLVVDFVSWRVILQELESLLKTGSVEPHHSLSFMDWTAAQTQYAHHHLSSIMASPPHAQANHSYWGLENKSNLKADVVTHKFVLNADTSSSILGPSNDALATRPLDLLLAALVHAFHRAFPDRVPPSVFSEGHGREPWDDSIDISTTVGWFTSIFPIEVSTGARANLIDTIRETKDSIRSLPGNGWSRFTGQFSSEKNAAASASTFPVEILFNYAGLYQQFESQDALFESVTLPIGCNPPSSLEIVRTGLFEIETQVERGQIAVSFNFNKNMKHEKQIRQWISDYESTLVKITQDLPSLAHQWTLSDFPMAFSSYDALNEMTHKWLGKNNIRAEDVEDIFPCSPVQEGMLIAQSKDPKNYSLCFEFDIRVRDTNSRLDRSRLQKAWSDVVKRHSLLRALLAADIPGTDRTMHVVLKNPEPSIHWSEGANGTEDINKSTVSIPSHGLQHRLTISKFDELSATLRFDMNHVIVDGFSRDILAKDLQEAYEGIYSTAGEFKNFIGYLANQPQEEGLSFWTSHLVGVEPCHLTSSTKVQSEGRAAHLVKIPDMDAESIRSFCSEWEITPALVIEAAWALVLGAYTGTKTPCFGSLYSGRDVPIDKASEIFGPLIGMVPCRVHVDGKRSVLELLKQLQSDYLSTLPHQYVPLVTINKAIGLSSQPLYNTALSFQHGGDYIAVDVSTISVHPAAMFDITEVSLSQARLECIYHLLIIVHSTIWPSRSQTASIRSKDGSILNQVLCRQLRRDSWHAAYLKLWLRS